MASTIVGALFAVLGMAAFANGALAIAHAEFIPQQQYGATMLVVAAGMLNATLLCSLAGTLEGMRREAKK